MDKFYLPAKLLSQYEKRGQKNTTVRFVEKSEAHVGEWLPSWETYFGLSVQKTTQKIDPLHGEILPEACCGQFFQKQT